LEIFLEIFFGIFFWNFFWNFFFGIFFLKKRSVVHACVVQCIGSIPHDVMQHRRPTATFLGDGHPYPSTDCHRCIAEESRFLIYRVSRLFICSAISSSQKCLRVSKTESYGLSRICFEMTRQATMPSSKA
jgi:hypothetical protein